MSLNHSRIIADLGGPTAVSRALFKDATYKHRVIMWSKREHIPWKWRLAIKRIADRRSVRLPDDFLQPETKA